VQHDLLQPQSDQAQHSASPYLAPRAESGVALNDADPASFSAAYDNGYWAYDQIGQSSGVASRTNLGADQGWAPRSPRPASPLLLNYSHSCGNADFRLCGPHGDPAVTGICAATVAAARDRFVAITDATPKHTACANHNPATPHADLAATRRRRHRRHRHRHLRRQRRRQHRYVLPSPTRRPPTPPAPLPMQLRRR